MLQKLEISGHHTEVTEDLQKYIKRKIGRLDRYISRHNRESAHAEVILSEVKAKDKKENVCEVIMYLPHEVITIKEATVNMFAAVDIVEARLKNQLKKYKEKHDIPRLHRRMLNRLQKTT